MRNILFRSLGILAPVAVLASSLGTSPYASIELPRPDEDDDLVKVILQWAPASEPVTVFPDGERMVAILSLDGRFPTKTELTLWAIGSYKKIEATGPRGDWEQFQEALWAVTTKYAITLGECDSKTDCENKVNQECEFEGYTKNCAKKAKLEAGTCSGKCCGTVKGMTAKIVIVCAAKE